MKLIDLNEQQMDMIESSLSSFDEAYRRNGHGRILIEEMEKRAREMGANTIRLDTFSWQGKEFYEALNYEVVGSYENEADGYAEYFFLKRI